METYKFKTNIKCGGCIAQVTPHLNALKSIDKWEVDTENPDKILTVSSDGINANLIQETVIKAGFKAEKI